MFRFRETFHHHPRLIGLTARDQHVGRSIGQLFRDADNLIGSFAQREDHFRNSVTQRAVMVHFGESQIFKRHVAHAFHGMVHIDCA